MTVLEIATTVVAAAVLGAATAIAQVSSGVVLSPALLVGIGVNFVVLVGFAVRSLAKLNVLEELYKQLKNVPEAVTRIEEQIKHIQEDVKELRVELLGKQDRRRDR